MTPAFHHHPIIFFLLIRLWNTDCGFKYAAVPKLAADHYNGLSRCWIWDDAYMAGLRPADKVWLHLPAESEAETTTLAKSRWKRL